MVFHLVSDRFLYDRRSGINQEPRTMSRPRLYLHFLNSFATT